MKPTPTNNRLDRALLELPRQRAREDFTERVLAGLEPDPAPVPPRWPRLALATVAALVLAVGLVTYLDTTNGQAAEQRTEALRREHSDLLAELKSLRLEAERDPMVLYVDGSDDLDVVLDLRPLVDTLETGVRPASYPAVRRDR